MKKSRKLSATFRIHLIHKNIFGNRKYDNEDTRDDPRDFDNSFREEEILGEKYIRKLGVRQHWPEGEHWKAFDFVGSKLEKAVRNAKREFGKDAEKVKIILTATRLRNGSYRHKVEYKRLE